MINLPYGFCSHPSLFMVFALITVKTFQVKTMDLWISIRDGQC